MKALAPTGRAALFVTGLGLILTLFPTWRMTHDGVEIARTAWISGFTFVYGSWGALLVGLATAVAMIWAVVQTARHRDAGAFPWIVLLAALLTLPMPLVGITSYSAPTLWGWIALVATISAAFLWFLNWRAQRTFIARAAH